MSTSVPVSVAVLCAGNGSLSFYEAHEASNELSQPAGRYHNQYLDETLLIGESPEALKGTSE